MAIKAVELAERQRTQEIIEDLRKKFFNGLARDIEKKYLTDVKI